MKLKQELGIRIVTDFHGHEAAEHAAQDWSRMFQKDETPDDLPLVTVKFADVAAPNAVLPSSLPLSDKQPREIEEASTREGSSPKGGTIVAPGGSSRRGDERSPGHVFNNSEPASARDTNPVVQVRLDKLLAAAGLATSVSDGSRKVKQNAVKVDGELKNELVASVKLGSEFTLRAGKKMVRVSVVQ